MMPESVKEIFYQSADPMRVDKLVPQEMPALSRAACERLIERGDILVNGKTVTKSYKVAAGDKVAVTLREAEPIDAQPQEIPLDIMYEDSDLLVVNKPKGVVVHPAAGNPDGTLVNALLWHCGGSLSGINGSLRPGIVHRIDKDTSGLLIVAKNDRAHQSLSAQIKAHSFFREYEAVVYGNVKAEQGRVEAPIGRHPVRRKQMAVTQKNAKNAATNYTVIRRYKGFTHLRLTLETGRTHQIRVHMVYIGHPVAGDGVYGAKKPIASLNGQCLHARSIGFVHPANGRYLEFTSELPEYFTAFLNKIKDESS